MVLTILVGYREDNFPAVARRAAGGEGERAKGWENCENRVGGKWLQDP